MTYKDIELKYRHFLIYLDKKYNPRKQLHTWPGLYDAEKYFEMLDYYLTINEYELLQEIFEKYPLEKYWKMYAQICTMNYGYLAKSNVFLKPYYTNLKENKDRLLKLLEEEYTYFTKEDVIDLYRTIKKDIKISLYRYQDLVTTY